LEGVCHIDLRICVAQPWLWFDSSMNQNLSSQNQPYGSEFNGGAIISQHLQFSLRVRF
jgi:hypothetical protein